MKNIRDSFYNKLIYKIIYLTIRKHLWKYKNELNCNSRKSRNEILSLQEQLLRDQVIYCYNNIKFYQERFKKVNFNPNKKWDLSEYTEKVPILKKDELISYFPKDVMPVHKSKKKLIRRQTSGSTGNPLVVFKDIEAVSYIDAAMMRNFSWYNISPGSHRAHFWGTGTNRKKIFQLKLRDFVANWTRFNCFRISTENILKYHHKINSKKPRYIYGYAKCIYEFAKLSLDMNRKINYHPQVVIVTGEKIYPWHKKIISDFFKAPVAEEYGCTECGVIAFECSKGNFHLMSDILFVETIKNGQPIHRNESGTIILTELRGNFFPLLRYQLGDKGILTDAACSCGIGLPLIKEIQGREDDYIVCGDGTKVDAYCIEYAIQAVEKTLGTVTRVAGIQRTLNEIEINVCGSFPDWHTWQYAFKKELKIYLKDINLMINKKDSADRGSTGKIKFFESLITK